MRDDFSDTEDDASKRPPPTPPFTWLGSGSPLLVAPLLSLVGVAMFAPDNVLDVWPFAKTFTTRMGESLTWIGNHALSTNYPQVALLMACMTVCILVWESVVFFIQSLVNYPTLLKKQQLHRTVSWGQAFLVVACVPVIVLCTIFAFAIPGDPSSAQGLTTTSRAGLTFICLGLVYGGGLMIGGSPLVIRLLIDLDLRQRD